MGFDNSRQQPKKKSYLLIGVVAGVLSLGIFGCCGLMSVAYFVQKSKEKEVSQELAEADVLWATGKKDDAVKKYKAILKEGVTDIERENRPTVFQRVIEYDVENGDTSSAKELVEKASLYSIALSFDNPKATKLLAEVEAKKKAEKYASARKDVSDDELKEMSLDQIRGRLGAHDEAYQSKKSPNVTLYVWKTGEDEFIAVSVIRRLDNGEPTVLVAATKRSRQIVEAMKKATDKF